MWRKEALFVLAAIFSIVALGGCGKPQATLPPATEPSKRPATLKTAKELAGKKVLLVVAPRDFRDEEFFTPKRVFEEKGAQVTVASKRKGTATGMRGGIVEPDIIFSEVRAADYDAVVIAGGMGSREFLWDDKDLLRIVREAYARGKVVAAICLSPVVLARAGCLDGKEATVFPDPEAVQELTAAGAKYADKSMVVAGNVVTARDPQSAGEFARAVAKLVDGKRVWR